MISNHCVHTQIKRDTHGWRCDDCLRTFFPSGDTGAEQAAVRLRASLVHILDMAVTAGYDAGHAGIETECRKALDDARNVVETKADGKKIGHVATSLRIWGGNRNPEIMFAVLNEILEYVLRAEEPEPTPGAPEKAKWVNGFIRWSCGCRFDVSGEARPPTSCPVHDPNPKLGALVIKSYSGEAAPENGYEATKVTK